MNESEFQEDLARRKSVVKERLFKPATEMLASGLTPKEVCAALTRQGYCGMKGNTVSPQDLRMIGVM